MRSDTIIDLKLLRVIHTVVSTGSVKATASKLQQSAGNISHQLGKARELTGAHLFVRTRRGMQPDSTALELSQRYQLFLDNNVEKKSIYQQPVNEIKINTYSLLEMMLSNRISEANTLDQPFKYIFKTYTSNSTERLRLLNERNIDIDIGNKLPPDPKLISVKVFTSKIHILVGERYKPEGDKFSFQDIFSRRHAVWSATHDYYSECINDGILINQIIQSRKIAVVSGSMINMVSLCANSCYIMLIPCVFSSMLENQFQVKCFPLPSGFNIYWDCYLHSSTQIGNSKYMQASVRDVIETMKKACSLSHSPQD